MNSSRRIITYKDELLTANSIRRVYEDGRMEWRHRLSDERVEWQDSLGNSGIDEMLADGIIKRTFVNGQVIYGREQGYGYTAWSNGNPITANVTRFGGHIGSILASIGASMILRRIVPPPLTLSIAEEEILLRAKAASRSVSSYLGSTTSSNFASDRSFIAPDDGDDFG